MGSRLAAAVLIVLLAVVHAQLWFGRGSVPEVAELQRQLDEQKARNAQARLANEQLAAEVRDLREGLEMVEERARMELGMVRQGEIFVQVARTGPSASASIAASPSAVTSTPVAAPASSPAARAAPSPAPSPTPAR